MSIVETGLSSFCCIALLDNVIAKINSNNFLLIFYFTRILGVSLPRLVSIEPFLVFAMEGIVGKAQFTSFGTDYGKKMSFCTDYSSTFSMSRIING